MEGAAIQHQGNRFRDFAADLVKPELESADRSAHRYMHVISGCRFYRGLPDGSFAAAAAAARGGQDGNGDDEQDHPAHGGRAYPSETVSFGAKTYRNGVKHLSVCPVSEALFSSPPNMLGHRGTNLVPDASSDMSDASRAGDAAGRMGRVRTHMADLSSGWGPSGRRFKSGLPDQSDPAWSRWRLGPEVNQVSLRIP